MATADELRKRLKMMLPELDRRAKKHRLQESYYTGQCPLPNAVVQARVTKAYRMLMPMAEAPWGSLVVDSVLDRLEVSGIRSDSRAVDDAVWGVWQDNQMDAESKLEHSAALTSGRSFALIQPVPGESPEITLDTSEQMIVQYIEGSRRRRVAALRRWETDDGKTYATLYLPDGVFRFQKTTEQRRGSGRFKIDNGDWWEPRGDNITDWQADNPLGVVPVVELAVNRRLKPGSFGYARGEYEHCTALIDRINLLTFLGLVVAFWQGFPLRGVLGAQIQWDFLVDDAGAPLLDTTTGEQRRRARPPFDAMADTAFMLEDPNAKIAEYAAADRRNLSVLEELAQLAMITKTPRHYFPTPGGFSNLPLALDTVVPTPTGRTTMGELAIGDDVFTPEGTAQKVVGLSPIFHGKPCYRMHFDDGSKIVADADHKWSTSQFIDPRRPYRKSACGETRKTAVVTTAEIAQSLTTAMGTSNHFIPVAQAHTGLERDYVIDPYALGVWLGDGSRLHATITSHRRDAHELADRLRACGETVSVRGDIRAAHADTMTIAINRDPTKCLYGHPRPRGTKRDTAKCQVCDHNNYLRRRYGQPMPRRANQAFIGRLRDLGLYANKHIPEDYFLGSVEQRQALLQGIMDTDGTASREQGSVAITLHDERLARDVHRLVQSLGMKVNLRERAWKTNGHGCVAAGEGTCWRMTWAARIPVFRMARKLALQRTDFGGGDGGSNRPLRRYVVACERVESVPVRCITVSSPSHLFCVTDAFIATHNSADAIRADEGGLNAKVVAHKGSLGEGHEETLRVCGLALPDPVYLSQRATLLWQDHEARSMAERADAAVKLKDILPRAVLWERYLNASLDDVQRWESLMAGDVLGQLLAEARAPVQAPELAASNGSA